MNPVSKSFSGGLRHTVRQDSIFSLSATKIAVVFTLAVGAFVLIYMLRKDKKINATAINQATPPTDHAPVFPPRSLANRSIWIPFFSETDLNLTQLARKKKLLIINNFLSRGLSVEGWAFVLKETGVNRWYRAADQNGTFIIEWKKGTSANWSITIDQEGKITASSRSEESPQFENPGAIQDIEKIFCKILGGKTVYQQLMNTRDQKTPLPFIDIPVLRRFIKDYAVWHISKLAYVLEKEWQRSGMPNIAVTFLKESDLERTNYTDVGGLSRDYLNDLISGLVANRGMFFQFPSSPLVIPQVEKNIDGSSVYYGDLGFILMYCYLSSSAAQFQPRLIGRHFDDAVFHVLRALKATDLDEEMLLTRKLEIAKVLVKAYQGTDHHIDYMKRRLDLLDKAHPSEEDLKEMAAIADETDFCTGFKREGVCKMDNIKIYLNKFRKSFAETVLLQEGSHGQLSKQIESMRAIAQGMKKCLQCYMAANKITGEVNAYWDHVIAASTGINEMIQGSTDKKEIAKRICIHPTYQGKQHIQQQTQWLKEWIENEATEEDVRHFLILVGGSPGLPSNKEILIVEQKPGSSIPIPQAQSCFYMLKLSGTPLDALGHHNRDKKGFIAALKLALMDPSAYQLGG